MHKQPYILIIKEFLKYLNSPNPMYFAFQIRRKITISRASCFKEIMETNGSSFLEYQSVVNVHRGRFLIIK